jgi:hypothetical protein
VVVAWPNDLRLDQPRVEPVSDDIGAQRCDDEPDGVDRLAAHKGDDRPGNGADDGDECEDNFVTGADRRAVDDGHRREVGVIVDVAQVVVGGGRGLRGCCHCVSCHGNTPNGAAGSLTRVHGPHGVDGVGFTGALVVPVAQHPGESQRQAAGVPRRCLKSVERHLDHLLGA